LSCAFILLQSPFW